MNIPKEAVEAAARAAFWLGGGLQDWSEVPEVVRTRYREEATAALGAAISFLVPERAVAAAEEYLSLLMAGPNGDYTMEARNLLEAVAPHMFADTLRLADKWQEDFPYKAHELRTALGVSND